MQTDIYSKQACTERRGTTPTTLRKRLAGFSVLLLSMDPAMSPMMLTLVQ